MYKLLNYIWPDKKDDTVADDEIITVSTVESVSVGCVACTLCSLPGSFKYFKGGVVCYSIMSKKDILGIDTKYTELNNFANTSTTLEMSKAGIRLFHSRICISTTGYSLPYYRNENLEKNECALDIQTPYALICLYDAKLDYHKIVKIEYPYDKDKPDYLQRSQNQASIAIEAYNMYTNYINTLKKPVKI